MHAGASLTCPGTPVHKCVSDGEVSKKAMQYNRKSRTVYGKG
jgi:hypothetical protein